jgi:hypothetical protein
MVGYAEAEMSDRSIVPSGASDGVAIDAPSPSVTVAAGKSQISPYSRAWPAETKSVCRYSRALSIAEIPGRRTVFMIHSVPAAVRTRMR